MQQFKKALFIIGGSICVVLAFFGIFIPILPTTPFLLLAVFFFTHSSDRALAWLLHNRWFGAYIRNYREGRGMALRDKVITLGFLWITIVLSIVFVVDTLWVRLVLLAVASGVSIHLMRIKTYRL